MYGTVYGTGTHVICLLFLLGLKAQGLIHIKNPNDLDSWTGKDPQDCLGEGDGGVLAAPQQRQWARQHTRSTQAQLYYP